MKKKNSLKNNEKTAQKKKIKETAQCFTVDCYRERLGSFSIFYNF